MLQLWVRAISPLAMSKHPMVAGRPTATHDYIPGTVLRGAIAAYYLKGNSNAAASCEFQNLFVSNRVKWGNLYPVKKTSPSWPLPATALSCKRFPGFLADAEDETDDPRHGIQDCLTEQIAYQFVKNARVLHEECSECSSLLGRYPGFYQGVDGEMLTVRVSKRLDTHTAIDHKTLSAKYESLFTIEIIEEGQEFLGFVDADDTCLEGEVRKLLDILSNSNEHILVGNDRSRGLGSVEICDHVIASLPLSPLEDRLKSFRKHLTDLSGQDICSFTLFLYSDAIILDNFLRYQSYIGEETLRQSLSGTTHCLPGCVKLERAYASSHMVAGWNAVGRLPKHVAVAIQIGSIFVFSYSKEKEDQLIKCLEHIEKNGVGERRSEGFGRVIVCHPFHQEMCKNGGE